MEIVDIVKLSKCEILFLYCEFCCVTEEMTFLKKLNYKLSSDGARL